MCILQGQLYVKAVFFSCVVVDENERFADDGSYDSHGARITRDEVGSFGAVDCTRIWAMAEFVHSSEDIGFHSILKTRHDVFVQNL